VAYHQPQQQWRQLPCPAARAQWREDPPPEALNVLPGLTFYFPPRQMARMRAAYTRARKADPRAFPTFQHFVLTRVTAGLAERCVSLAPGTESRSAQTAGGFPAAQLELAARQLGVDQMTLLYWLVVPEDARREQRWQAIQALFAHSMSAHWGRRGCTSSLVGLGAVGLLLCCLLSFAEAIAAFLVQHPH
jgi:hypothetical protein